MPEDPVGTAGGGGGDSMEDVGGGAGAEELCPAAGLAPDELPTPAQWV